MPVHEQDIVDGFNAIQKRLLPTCLRIRSTPKLDKIGSKSMCVHAMTEKGKLSFAEECKSLLEHHDKIGTKGDKKNRKREAKAHLKHKYNQSHTEEDIIFNGMKAVYNILNNQDKVTMKHFYHIRCDPDLDKGLCVM